jgi:iron complex transport system ATP-binding protein
MTASPPDPAIDRTRERDADVPALEMIGVGVRRDGTSIVSDVDWEVRADERWVLLGANGSGKTTLVRIAALYDHPSTGVLRVLGQQLGRCDVRTLRRRLAFVSAGFADLVRPDLVAADVVMCGLNAALEPWWHTYSDDDRERARAALDSMGIGRLADHRFGSLSSGERQRVQLARALMTRPELLLLDEPTAGLDLAGREEFIADLERIGPGGPPMVLVTHHLEEIPATFTHVMLIAGGGVLAKGPIDDTLTAAALSRAAGIAVDVERHGGRWSARAVR